MLFRKFKARKLVIEYSRVYDVKVEGIGVEALEGLKQVQLKELALAYDAIEGYQYYKEPLLGIAPCLEHNMPDYSKATPSVVFAHPVGGLVRGVRIYKNLKMIQRGDFIIPQTATSLVKIVAEGSTKWKV